MVRLVAPNGSAIEASDEAAPKLVESGFFKAEKQRPKKSAARRRSTRQKRQQ